MVKVWIAIGAFLLGVASGYGIALAKQNAASNQLDAWRTEMDAVNRWFEEIPGFTEHKSVLQPLLNIVQYNASEDIAQPPQDERARNAYRDVVVLFLAQEHLEGLDPGPANVINRALKRIRLNPYWTDPEAPDPASPREVGQEGSGGN